MNAITIFNMTFFLLIAAKERSKQLILFSSIHGIIFILSSISPGSIGSTEGLLAAASMGTEEGGRKFVGKRRENF
jgi:hypothetical protein